MKKYLILFGGLALLSAGCTKLDEKLNSELTRDEAQQILKANQLLQAAYNSMQGPFQDQARLWCLQEHTTDEAVGPTRAGDWDDNGIWRVLHQHTWDADHSFITSTYNDLLGVVFNATNVLNFKPSVQETAEAKFIRAYVMYTILDGWNQVPIREPGEDLRNPSKVLTGTAALDFIISELNAALPGLPNTGPIFKANKNAARALLMRCYLNKAVIANRASPSHAAADMNKVISLADTIIGTSTYMLTPSVFDNFTPNNDVTGKGIIFAIQNLGGSLSGNIRSRWFCTLHYNQTPSGWNGFTTLGDFYDKYEAADTRRNTNYPGLQAATGLNMGFLFGQQFDKNGAALQDRRGNNLAFTKAVSLIETGNNLEITGIRVIKYVPDLASGDNVNNDAVLIRFEDVILMKAEAILRGGTATSGVPAPYNTPLNIVNAIRTRSNATPLTSVTLDQLLDERGREFVWEGLRRSDLIRFGKFLQPTSLRTTNSTATRLLFPIPNGQLAVNPNLKQNPGY